MHGLTDIGDGESVEMSMSIHVQYFYPVVYNPTKNT